MAFQSMLWNKVRRDLYAITRGDVHRHATFARWNLAYVVNHCKVPFAMSILQFAIPSVGHVTHGIQTDALEQSEASLNALASAVPVDEEPSPGRTWPTAWRASLAWSYGGSSV